MFAFGEPGPKKKKAPRKTREPKTWSAEELKRLNAYAQKCLGKKGLHPYPEPEFSYRLRRMLDSHPGEDILEAMSLFSEGKTSAQVGTHLKLSLADIKQLKLRLYGTIFKFCVCKSIEDSPDCLDARKQAIEGHGDIPLSISSLNALTGSAGALAPEERPWVWVEFLDKGGALSKQGHQSGYYRAQPVESGLDVGLFLCGYPGLCIGLPLDSKGKDWEAYSHRPGTVSPGDLPQGMVSVPVETLDGLIQNLIVLRADRVRDLALAEQAGYSDTLDWLLQMKEDREKAEAALQNLKEILDMYGGEYGISEAFKQRDAALDELRRLKPEQEGEADLD